MNGYRELRKEKITIAGDSKEYHIDFQILYSEDNEHAPYCVFIEKYSMDNWRNGTCESFQYFSDAVRYFHTELARRYEMLAAHHEEWIEKMAEYEDIHSNGGSENG